MSTKQVFAKRASVAAVQGALICFVGMPMAIAQNSVAELTTPVNTVEIGIVSPDNSSYKFGEYNGLQKKRLYPNGGFDLYGGDPDTAERLRITGQNLGLDNRSLDAEFGVQGKFRLSLGYDELRHNISDSYMSPYLGTGTGTLTLPTTWETNRLGCSISGTATGNTNFGGVSNATAGTSACGNYYVNQNSTAGNKTATPVGNAAALTAAELAAFQTVPLHTKRAKTSVGVLVNLTPAWTLTASAKHEEKDGVQAIGQAIGGAAANGIVVANPIRYETNQLDLKLAYASGNAFAELGYYVSLFDDQIKSLTYDNPWFTSKTPSVSATGVATFPYPDTGRMATAPSNQLHQVNATGGYNFSKTTKLIAYASYGRNTQNDAYLPAGTGTAAALPLPRTALGGEVVNTTYGLKFTSRPIRALNLGASYKYDERDNRTPIASYTTPFNPQDGQIATTTFPYNPAYSRKLKQGNLDADWGFAAGQAVKLGWEQLDSTRWCSTLPTGVTPCVNATDSSERSIRVEYRNSMFENLNGRIGYVSSDRSASTYGPNVSFLAGDLYTRFNMTDRKRDKLRSQFNWSATDALDLSLSYEATKDKYTLGRNPSGLLDLGLESYDSKVFNLDATYRISEKLSVNAFYSDENMSSLLKGSGASNATAVATALAAVPGGAYWSADLKDKVRTFGLNVRATGLLGNKLDLGAGYLSSRGSSPYAVAVGSYLAYSSGAVPGVAAQALANTLVKGAITGFPNTYANSDSISLSAKYNLSKKSALRFSIVHEKLSSADPAFYTGLQAGAANVQASGSTTAKVNGVVLPITNVYPYSTLLPTNEQAPNYSATAVGVSYIYSF